MGVRFSPSARKAIDHALSEVEGRRHALLDTGHLLLGLLERGTATALVLAALGVDAERLRAELDRDLAARDAAAPEELTVHASMEQALERAAELARQRGDPVVSDADIFVACAEQRDSRAAMALARHGVLADAAREMAATLPVDAGDGPAARPVVTRVGNGYDSHRFGTEGPMRLGGIDIEGAMRLVGHSDGDAIAHAVTDAILGAAGAGDIGEMFADTDPANRGRDSIEMLRAAVQRIGARGWRVQQVDVTVIAEQPKIAPHRAAMRRVLAAALAITEADVSIKGKTNEGMGWIGRHEGIACLATATIVRDGADGRRPMADGRSS